MLLRALSLAVVACLWDSDTFSEEALQQRDVGPIVSGRIEKHSTFFYEQKVAYTKRLVDAADAGMERYDDLAVAHEKLGHLDDAILVMEAKEQRFPGEYTTLANLGTFFAHQGNFDRASRLLKQAVAKNPDAHFGREKYQIQAIDYIRRLKDEPDLVKQKDLLGLNVQDEERLIFGDTGKKKPGQKTGLEKAGLSKEVLIALAGIIRFGSGEKSAHVWFSLGMALAYNGDRHLALRAFFQASELGHPLGLHHAELIARTVKPQEGKVDPAALRAEFARGQAAVKALQDAEDARLRKGELKQVFGY